MATVGAVTLPQEVEEITTRYRAQGGEDVRAAFVIGSAALGDWWPGESDIDMVAIVDSVDPAREGRLRDIHARVRADLGGAAPDLEVLYLTAGDLAQAPAQVGSRPHHRSGLLRRDAEMSTPVIWHSLAQHAVPIGETVELGEIWLDDSELREWCRSNLVSYWAGWAARGAQPATRGGMALLADWAVAWCVLGVLRLRHTIDTGAITSKSGAGHWALEALRLDASERGLVEEALSLRRAAPHAEAGADRAHAAERRDQVAAFLRRIIDDSSPASVGSAHAPRRRPSRRHPRARGRPRRHLLSPPPARLRRGQRARIGASHYVVPPGARQMPVHVHGDEEEIFFVLSGDGLGYELEGQDPDGQAVTYRVAAGDTIVHRPDARPHTFLAGDNGLELIAFGSGSETSITYLPRAGVMWCGPRWVPVDAPHPFAAEAAAGPVQAPGSGG